MTTTPVAPVEPSLPTALEGIEKLRKDLREAAILLTKPQARYFVDAYYAIQQHRIEAQNQVRSLERSEEPNELIAWLFGQHELLEREIGKALGGFASSHAPGVWAQSITGCGPIIAAGLLAHIDVTKANTAGKVWRFAGLDSTVKWHGSDHTREVVKAARAAEADDWHAFVWLCRAFNMRPGLVLQNAGLVDAPISVENATPIYLARGGDGALLDRFQFEGDNVLLALEDAGGAFAEAYPKVKIKWDPIRKTIARRPWNAGLKVLCWKLGESFVKVSKRAYEEEPEPSENGTAATEVDDSELVGRALLPAPAKPEDLYVWMFAKRKIQEIKKNEHGDFADQAQESLRNKRYGRDTDAYVWYSGSLTREAAREVLRAPSTQRQGLAKKLAGEPGSGVAMLPPARIHLRAKRYAVKTFLAHFHHVAYVTEFDQEPPLPYVIQHLGHVNYVGPPNWPLK